MAQGVFEPGVKCAALLNIRAHISRRIFEPSPYGEDIQTCALGPKTAIPIWQVKVKEARRVLQPDSSWDPPQKGGLLIPSSMFGCFHRSDSKLLLGRTHNMTT